MKCNSGSGSKHQLDSAPRTTPCDTGVELIHYSYSTREYHGAKYVYPPGCVFNRQNALERPISPREHTCA